MRSVTHQRFVSLAVAAVVALTTTASAALAQERVNARVAAGGALNVRTGPASGYRVLGAIPDGTPVEVRLQLGGWSQIAFGAGAAWVPTAFLEPLTAASSDAARVGAVLDRIALPPTTSNSSTTSILVTGLVNLLRTQLFPTSPISTPSIRTVPTLDTTPTIGAAPTTGTTSIGTTSIGAPAMGSTTIGAPQTTPPTAPRTTPTTPTQTTPTTTQTQTTTAPSAPASTTPLPTSSAYAPTGTVPAGQSGGYIQLRASGAGHYGYGTAARKYGRPALIYGLERISAQFASTGHKMGVGDISQNGGGRISGHASHTLGIDVDVRPCRKDKTQQPVTWQQTAVYDRAATQTLLNLFGKELKLTNFFYNDPQVNVRTKTNWPNHDNHFHARINPN